MRAIRQRWKVFLPLGLIGALALGWLAFGFFGVQALFIDDVVDEAPPVFASGAGASGFPSDDVSEDINRAMNEFMAENGIRAEQPADEAPPTGSEVVELSSGEFIDRSHPGDGRAVILNDGTEQRFLRFEDFVTDNGPDLNVYLSAAPADSGDLADDFIDLGDLKGNIGPQNYEIPPEVDLERYSTVVVWCVRFGVAFTAADLMQVA